MAWNSKRSSFIVDDIHSDFLAELMPGGTGDSNDFSYFGPQGSKNDNYFGSSFSPSAPYRSSVFLQQEPQGFTRLASFAALNRASFQQSNKEAGWEVVTDHCKNLQSIALYFAATSNSVTNLAFLDFFSHVLRLLQMTLKLRPESIPFDQLKGQFHELFPSDETSSTSTNTNASSSSSSTPPSIVDTDSNPPGPPSPQVSSSATTNPHPLSHSTSASTLSAPSSSPQHQQQQQQQHMNIQTGLSQGVLSKGGQNNSASPSSLMSDFAMSGPPPPVQSGFNSSTMAQFSSMNSLSNAYQQPSQQQFQQPQFTTQQQQNIGQNSIGFYGQQQQAAPFQMHDGFGMNQLGNNSNGNGVVGGKSLEQQKNDALSAPVNLSASSSTNSSGTSGLGAISNNSSSSNLNLSSLSNLTGLSSRNNAGGSGTNLAGSINNSVTNNVVGSSSSMFSGAYSQQVAPQLGLRNPNDHTNTTMGLPVSNTPNYLPPTVFTSNPFSGLPVSAQHNLMSRNNLLPIPVKPPINQSPEKQGPGQQQPLQQPQQHLQYLPPQLQQQQQSQQQQMLPITHANLHAHLQGPHHPGQPFLRPKEPATSTSTSVAAASATLDHMPSDSAQMNKMMGAGFMMIPGMGYPGEFGKGMLDGSGGDPGWPKRKRKRVMSRTNLKCRICQETETPEWRKGPDGNHTLCNACGLNYAKKLKQERQVLEKAGRRRTSIDTILEDKKFHFSDLIASERAKKGTEKRPNPLRTASHSSQFPSEDGTNSGSADGDDQFSVPPPPSSSPSNSSSQSIKREYKHDDEDDDDEYEDDEDLQNNGSSSSGSNNDNDEAMRDFGNSRNAPGPSSHLNPANFGNNLQQQQQQQLQVHQHQQQQQQYQQQQQQQFGFNPSLPSRAESMGSLMNPNLNLNMGLSQSGPKLETSQSASSLQQLQQQQQQLQQQQGQGQNPQRPY
eukprot:TRINITY_DN1087_c1_g1_i1.p1 TRINITY_DN1087_c1_g1~~TRINITY_DN1087_c1_g1_i1.p1  ORF type:complete len:944 (-),score=420.62 TRINITY_DN1087_c1_g1_i1:274-3105(-)